MRVAVDVRSLMDSATGIGTVAGSWCDALLALGDDVHIVGYAFGGRAPGERLAALCRHPRFSLRHVPLPMRVMRQLWRRTGRPSLERFVGDVDLVVATETTMPRCRAPVIAVVHDLLFFEHPAWFNAYTRRAGPENLDDVLARAAHVACVSETTRATLLARAPGLSSRTSVVPPAVAQQAPAASERQDDGKTVLFVGTREPRKGIGTVSRALLAIPTARFVVAGRSLGDALPDQQAIDALAAAGRLDVLDYVDLETLHRLRRTCAVAVVPSLDEGFGLPLLEALAAGVPVVCSDIPIFREVAGDVAWRAAPGDAEAWRRALATALDDAEGRRARSRDGIIRAAHYAPAACEAAVRDVVRRVLPLPFTLDTGASR